MLDPLDTELQTTISHVKWILGTKLRSLTVTASLLPPIELGDPAYTLSFDPKSRYPTSLDATQKHASGNP